ncbi:MAG: hypothetical protein LC126_15765 [Bryobacterales bacterium]|nr:hypothetical protein [Bryobacterales bacterium]
MAIPSSRAGAERGAQWLLAMLEPDGSFRGATALDAYYKGPCALWFSGHRAEAGRLLDFAAKRFLGPAGDLDGTGVPWYDRFRIYPHSWLAWAALEMDRRDIAEPLVRFLLTRWNAESGGFLADAEGAEEIMTTSMAGLACLRAGHTEAARGVAGWLDRVMREQPDLHRGLLHVRKPGIGLTGGDGSVWFIVDAAKPRQWYFQYGISAAFLADFSKRIGEARWLDLARAYLHASAHCYEDRYRTPQSGKIGWGAAWTYALSGREEDRALADAVLDGLCALQCGDGSWNAEGVYEAQPAKDPVARIDVTSEFVALLSLMAPVEKETANV